MVAATRGLERGRTDNSTVDAAFAEDLQRWIEVQRAAGVDYYSDGLLRWQDLFRPLVQGLGVKPHTLVRWFDTNTFFRQGEFGDSVPRLTSLASLIPEAAVPMPRMMTLPSPYLFSRAVHTTRNRNPLMQQLASEVLKPAIDAGVAAGVKLVHLEEPWIPYEGIDKQQWSALADALQVLHDERKATLVLHLYFGDVGPYIAQLLDLPVDAIGVDLIETDVAALGKNWKKALVAGIVSGRDSRIESTDNLVEAIRYLTERLQPPSLYLTSNCELTYLPTPVAERKVGSLGEAARRLNDLVAA